MISQRPVTSSVLKACDVSFAIFFSDPIPVDVGLPGFPIDTGNVELGNVVRKRGGPEKLAGAAVEYPYTPSLRHCDQRVTLLAARNPRVDPFHCFGIRVEARPE